MKTPNATTEIDLSGHFVIVAGPITHNPYY